MLIDRIKNLNSTKARVAALEAEIREELDRELATLPGRFGFASVDDFAAAVKAAAGIRRGPKPGPKKESAAPVKKPQTRKRVVITDEIRQQVKKLVGEGKTGNEIAKTVGISLPSVQNIKKALGLVKK